MGTFQQRAISPMPQVVDLRGLHYTFHLLPMNRAYLMADTERPEDVQLVFSATPRGHKLLVITGGTPVVSNTGPAVAGPGGVSVTGVVGRGRGASAHNTGAAVASSGGVAVSGVVYGSISGASSVPPSLPDSPFRMVNKPLTRQGDSSATVYLYLPVGITIYY